MSEVKIFTAAFTVELVQSNTAAYEGENLDISVRLEGRTSGSVGIQLELLTLSQFLTRPEAPPGYTLSEDPAECKLGNFRKNVVIFVSLVCAADDFSHDEALTHTFPSVPKAQQSTAFNIDIVNDAISEKVEQFVVLVTNVNIDGNDSYSEGERLFATVTILVNPDAPDSQSLSFSFHQRLYFSVHFCSDMAEDPCAVWCLSNSV